MAEIGTIENPEVRDLLWFENTEEGQRRYFKTLSGGSTPITADVNNQSTTTAAAAKITWDLNQRIIELQSELGQQEGTLLNYLPLVGGALSGPLSLAGDPSENDHAARKQYVDNSDANTLQGSKTYTDEQLKTEVAKINKAIDALKPALASGGVPVGSLVPFAGKSIPNGYLLCNGAAVSRTTYAALFAVIGTTYGAGDGSKTFTLPDFRNRFIEGSTTAGTRKNAGLPNITGYATQKDYFGRYESRFNPQSFGAFSLVQGQNGNAPSSQNSGYSIKLDFNAHRSSSIYSNSSTVQPASITSLILIKT